MIILPDTTGAWFSRDELHGLLGNARNVHESLANIKVSLLEIAAQRDELLGMLRSARVALSQWPPRYHPPTLTIREIDATLAKYHETKESA